MDDLYDAVVRLAQDHLRRRDEFAPFALTVDVHGAKSLETSMASEEHPDAREDFELLCRGIRGNRDRLRSVAICANRDTYDENGKHDAIVVSLEHRSGEAVDVIMTYTKTASGEYAFGEPEAQHGTPRVFKSKSVGEGKPSPHAH